MGGEGDYGVQAVVLEEGTLQLLVDLLGTQGIETGLRDLCNYALLKQLDNIVFLDNHRVDVK